MNILVDSREKKPYWEKNRVTLICGDYTTEKLRKHFCIERKSLQDLYGTLTSGNNRFKYELFRAAFHQIKIVVFVDGTYEDFINKRFPKGDERKFTTAGLERLVSTFTKKYYLEFNWHKSRAAARKAAQSRLAAAEKALNSAKKGIK